MITGLALRRDGELEFPEKTYILITVSNKESNEISCVMREKNSNCIQTRTFKRVGGEIKSGVDLGDCIRYVPPKKILKIGQEITLPMGLKATISEVFRKTADGGWSCLVKIGNSISHSWEIVYP
jgi:hypothetical protein